MKIKNCSIDKINSQIEVVVNTDDDMPMVGDFIFDIVKKIDDKNCIIYKGEKNGYVVIIMQDNTIPDYSLQPLAIKCSNKATALVHNYFFLSALDYNYLMGEDLKEPDSIDVLISFKGSDPTEATIDFKTAKKIASKMNADLAIMTSSVAANETFKSLQFIPKGEHKFFNGMNGINMAIDRIIL